jgi:hypothetical protein
LFLEVKMQVKELRLDEDAEIRAKPRAVLESITRREFQRCFQRRDKR